MEKLANRPSRPVGNSSGRLLRASTVHDSTIENVPSTTSPLLEPIFHQDDHRLHVHRVCEIAGVSLDITASTIAARPHPLANDDAFLLLTPEDYKEMLSFGEAASMFTGTISKRVLAAVADGVTFKHKNSDLESYGIPGGRYSSHSVIKYLKKMAQNLSDLSELFKAVNREVVRQGGEIKDMDGEGKDLKNLATSTLTGNTIDSDGTVQYAHVADSFLIVWVKSEDSSGSDTAHVITKNANEKYDSAYESLRRWVRAKIPGKATLDEIKVHPLVDTFLKVSAATKFNRADGQGVGIMGAEGIEPNIQSGVLPFPLHRISMIYLGTDGSLWPGCSLSNEEDRNQLGKILRAHGAEGLLRYTRAQELSDLDCKKVLRSKPHDDATGICIRTRSLSKGDSADIFRVWRRRKAKMKKSQRRDQHN